MTSVKFLSLIFVIAWLSEARTSYSRDASRKELDGKIGMYMGCNIKDRMHYDRDFLKPACNITIEIPDLDGSVERLTCDIDQPPFTNLLNLYYEISGLVSNNVVILYGTGKSYANIRIVRMKECRYRDVFIDVEPLRPNDFGTVEVNLTLNKDHSFNVFYEDRSECQTGVCMDIYDFNGRLLEGPYDVNRPSDNLNVDKITYAFGEQYGGNIGLTYDYDSIMLVSYEPQDRSKILFKLPRHNVTVLSVSTINEHFGLCYKWNGYRKAACLQYDKKGHRTFNSNFYYPRDWTNMRVTNRYEGNFTVLSTNCTIENCDPEHGMYRVDIMDNSIKYGRPHGFIPLVCRSRVGDKSQIEIGFDYAIYMNCKPSMRGWSHAFMFKSWCSEFIRCSPVIL